MIQLAGVSFPGSYPRVEEHCVRMMMTVFAVQRLMIVLVFRMIALVKQHFVIATLIFDALATESEMWMYDEKAETVMLAHDALSSQKVMQ